MRGTFEVLTLTACMTPILEYFSNFATTVHQILKMTK